LAARLKFDRLVSLVSIMNRLPMNLKSMLEEAVGRCGEKTAIISGDCRMSYAELDEASNKVASALLEMGVGKGERVAMLLLNSPQFVVVYFGIVKTGAIAVPLDTKYKPSELVSLLNHCQPRAIFAEGPSLETVASLLSRLSYIEHVIDVSSEGNREYLSYEDIMRNGSARRVEVAIADEDIANIGYTSGPAFQPKGAMLSHGSLVRSVQISADGFRQTEEDIVMLFALPMHHIVGLVIILLTAVYKASTVVILPGLSINSLMELIERERVSIFIGVPFIHALIVKKASEEGIEQDLSSLRICGSIGAPLPPPLIRRFEECLGFRLINFYGLTESTAHVTCQPLNGSGRFGSIGKTLPGWQVKIVGDDGRKLSPDHIGEIAVKGPIMSCYYNSPQQTADMIKDGWLHTSDLGRMDGDGCIFLTGIKKDMIITKGQNIYPSDIEGVLMANPAVAQVAVAGVPDEMRGEVVGAAVVLKAGQKTTEQQLKKYCLGQLANYKIPKKIVFLESLPQKADGSPDKKKLAEYLAQAYNGSRGN